MAIVIMPAAADQTTMMVVVTTVVTMTVIMAIVPAPGIVGMEAMPCRVIGCGRSIADKTACQQQCQRN